MQRSDSPLGHGVHSAVPSSTGPPPGFSLHARPRRPTAQPELTESTLVKQACRAPGVPLGLPLISPSRKLVPRERVCASQTLLSQNKLSECRGRNLRLISAHDTVGSVFVLGPPRRGGLGDARPAQGIPGGSLPRQMPNAAAPGLVAQVWSSESPVPGIWGAGEDLKTLVGSAGWEPPPPGQPPTTGPISWTLWSIPSAGPASSKLRVLVYRDRASGTRLFCTTVAARKRLSSVTSPH